VAKTMISYSKIGPAMHWVIFPPKLLPCKPDLQQDWACYALGYFSSKLLPCKPDLQQDWACYALS